MDLDIRDPEEMEYINMCLKKYRSNRAESSKLLALQIRRRINRLFNGDPETNSPIAAQACAGVSAIIRGTFKIRSLREAWQLDGDAEKLADEIINAMGKAKKGEVKS